MSIVRWLSSKEGHADCLSEGERRRKNFMPRICSRRFQITGCKRPPDKFHIIFVWWGTRRFRHHPYNNNPRPPTLSITGGAVDEHAAG
ncbi:hypothetical protein J6590_050524 [Homalodisca vitripennis]|nr:hypothetical protein J6590_050524 [Homalodisca vitripennis]